MQCLQEQGHPSFEFQQVEIRDDGLYVSTCNQGHNTLTVIQQQKFEVLFDFGAMALIDGYPREAVTSIAAALERFYEFYIAVICLKHGIDTSTLKATWKHVASQSERQFGGYLFSYLIDHKNVEPPVIDNERPNIDGIPKGKTRTWKEFRNDVVHKGYIPSVAETLAYGNVIYLHLIALIEDLKSRSGESIQQITFHHIARAHEAADGNVVSTMCIPTIVSLTREETPPESFEKALESVAEYKKWLHHA